MIRGKLPLDQMKPLTEPAPERAYLIALNDQHARSTADIDAKWERVSACRRIYKDQDGRHVQLVSDVRQLYGIRHGTRLYLGYKYNERRDFDELVHMIRSGRFVCYRISRFGIEDPDGVHHGWDESPEDRK